MEHERLNLITQATRFEGTVEFNDYTRFDGYLKGVLRGLLGCEIILGENGVVEGKIEADIVTIDGFVRGEIRATTKVVVSETGRVVGQIHSPSLAIKFGGYFDGSCEMNSVQPEEKPKRPLKPTISKDRAL